MGEEGLIVQSAKPLDRIKPVYFVSGEYNHTLIEIGSKKPAGREFGLKPDPSHC